MLRLSTLTLFLTWRCTIACTHCGFFCGPKRTGRMALDTALRLIDEAAALDDELRMVAYSGGEPFLLYDDLLACMRRAAELGKAAGLVSNCSWAGDDAVVHQRLDALRDLGLEEFIVSLDDYHLAHVPLENVRRVVHGALDRGVRVGVNVLATQTGGLRRAHVPELLGLNPEQTAPERMWMQESSPLLFGRAKRHFRREELIVHPEQAFQGLACHYVTRNMVVSPEGRVYACCGFGGSTESGPAALTCMGDLREEPLEVLFRQAQGNLALNIMASHGPLKLLELARDVDPGVVTPRDFVSPCDICGEISTNDRLRGALATALRRLAAH